MKLLITAFFIGYILSGLLACKKFVDVPPPSTQLTGALVYNTNQTASAAVTGIFQTMTNSHPIGGGGTGVSALLGLSADEFKLYPTTLSGLNEAYTNSLTSYTSIPFWTQLYFSIYQTNAAIEGLSGSNTLTDTIKLQLIGEAKFARALCYFYLQNIYGDVPLATRTNYVENSLISRSSQSIIFDQIIADLKESQNLLSDNYKSPIGATVATRVRPNKGAATALLARVYLYQQKWKEAEFEASSLINNNLYQLLPDLNKVFLASNNKEAIWQLESPNTGFNAADGTFLRGYNSTAGPSSGFPFLLDDSLYVSFEAGDLRKSNWTISKTIGSVTYRFPYKYKLSENTNLPPVENQLVLRLAEQYLIRAEARIHLGNILGAQQDLNKIRNRAGLGNTSLTTPSTLLTAIYNERRFELFTEYGHRWLDLKRSGTVDVVMNVFTPFKGGIWKTTHQLYPIPVSEIQVNPNLTQNADY